MLERQHGTSEAGNSGLRSNKANYLFLTDAAWLARSVEKLPEFADTQHRSDSAALFRARSLKTGWEMLRGAGGKCSSRVSHQ